MAPPMGSANECSQTDIIRIPMTAGDTLRVLGVCARCGAFRDVTGLSASEAYDAIHEGPQAAENQTSALRQASE